MIMAYAVSRVEDSGVHSYRGDYELSMVPGSSEGAMLTPHRLTQMLLEGAVVSTEHAISAIERQDEEAKIFSIDRCVEIIDGLYESLNMERGGEVAQNLAVVYLYSKQELLHAKVENCADSLKSIAEYLSGISDSWKAIG
jgi:flagellar protein FliS